ncbi:MAG: hypothetical protein U0165_00165 [Polyangiaceae bacterium]
MATLTKLAERLERVEPGPWTVDFATTNDEVIVLSAQVDNGKSLDPARRCGHDRISEGSGKRFRLACTASERRRTWFPSVARGAFNSLGCSVPRNVQLISNSSGRLYVNSERVGSSGCAGAWARPSCTAFTQRRYRRRRTRTTATKCFLHRGFYARLPLTLARLLTEQTRLGDEVEQLKRRWVERVPCFWRSWICRSCPTTCSADASRCPNIARSRRSVALLFWLARVPHEPSLR